MPDLTLILLGAGKSSRFGYKTKKQWIRIDDKPLWYFLSEKLIQIIKQIIKEIDVVIVADKSEINYMKNFCNYTFVKGGKERQISLQNALKEVKTEYVLVTDIARACPDKTVIQQIIEKKGSSDVIVPFIQVSDTVHYKNDPINRDDIKLIQTPQLSKTKVLRKSISGDKLYTDESSAILDNGGTVTYIKGSKRAKKLTYFEDLKDLVCLTPPASEIFTGFGYDVHPFENEKKMYLGGVKINEDYGFKAHSDGDVALHALIDALLGAIGAGDIGELFPDDDAKYKNIDSKELLQIVSNFISNVGYDIINCDITICAQTPKISPYKQEMKKIISDILNLNPQKVNIKATTTEKLGFIGRKEGVGVYATASLKYTNWQSDLKKEMRK